MRKLKSVKSAKLISTKKIKIFLILIFVGLFAILPVIISLAQEKDKTIEHLFSDEPIKVKALKVAEKSVKSGEKFSAPNDWLKNLSIEIENTSGKTIKHIIIGLHILRPKEQENIPPLHFALERGVRDKAIKGEDSAFVLKSDSKNNLASISVSLSEYDNIRNSLNELNYPDKIGRIQFQIEEIIFDDRTAWAFGTWYKINPNDGKFIVDEEKRSSAKIGTASSTGECVSVYSLNPSCGIENGVTCYIRRYEVNGTGNQELVARYESCYTRDSNGQRDRRCNAQQLINLPICLSNADTDTDTNANANADTNSKRYLSKPCPSRH